MDETELSWRKLERQSTKVGYREGVSDGRDSNFQKSFDQGYAEGFKNGFALGVYKGALVAKAKLEAVVVSVDGTLEKTTRGNCEICKDESKLNGNCVEEVVRQQNKATDEVLSNLHSKYVQVLYMDVPDKLQ